MATVRQPARLFVGFALGWERRFDRVTESPDTLTRITGIGTDTVVVERRGRRILRAEPGDGFTGSSRPVIGVDFPMWPSWKHVRLSLATAADDFGDIFYVGASVLSAVFGLKNDPGIVDVHIYSTIHIAKIGRVDPLDPFERKSHTRVLWGVGGVMATFDASSAVKAISGVLLPG